MQGFEPGLKPGDNSVVCAFRRERLGPVLAVPGLVLGGPVRSSCLGRFGQQGQYPCAFGVEQFARPLVVHLGLPFQTTSERSPLEPFSLRSDSRPSAGRSVEVG